VGTKENTVTLPVALLLIEWLIVAGRAPESVVARLLWLAPFLLTPAIELAVLFSFREKVGAMVQFIPGQAPGRGGAAASAGVGHSRASTFKGLGLPYMGAYQGRDFPTMREYLLTQPGVLLGYLKLWVLPMNQVFDALVVPVTKIRDARLLLPALALLAFLGAALKQIRTQPLVAFGVLWFFLTMAVESSVIPLADFRFEHRMLLPSVGLTVAALAWIGPAIARRPRAGGALLAVAVLALGGATLARNRVWADPITFWSDNVAKAPGKLRGWVNLAHAYEMADQLDLAEDALLRAVVIFDRSAEVHFNLGVIRMRQGKPGAAETSFRRALALSPFSAEAYYNLGTLLAQTGRWKAAEGAFRWVIRIRKDYVPEANYNLGVLYLREGRPEAAARALEAAVAAQPGLMVAHHNLAVAYGRLGRAEDARRQAAIAARLRASGKKGAER
jgi:Tfp pilus assembly protein PilF